MTEFIYNIVGDLTTVIEQYNYIIIFTLMTIESSFIPFPSEIIMIPAGYLISQQKLSFSLSIASGVLGSIFGALINYYLSKKLGLKILKKYGKYCFLPETKLNKIFNFFQNHGSISTFTSRFIPGIRQYISIPAGLANMPIAKFIFYTGLGSLMWCMILVMIGIIFGNNQELIKENLKIVMIMVFLLIILIIYIYMKLQTHKNNKIKV